MYTVNMVNQDDQKQTADDTGYHVHDLDDRGTTEEDVTSTDPDHFADDLYQGNKDRSSDFDDSNDPDDVPNTDLGGEYDREEVFDEDSGPKEAGTLGHPGIDDDTA